MRCIFCNSSHLIVRPGNCELEDGSKDWAVIKCLSCLNSWVDRNVRSSEPLVIDMPIRKSRAIRSVDEITDDFYRDHGGAIRRLKEL